MSEPTLQLDFGDAVIASEAFQLLDTDPTTARDAGVSMSQEFRVVPIDADPAWRVRFRLAPLTRPAAHELRRRVGARLMFHVERPGPAVRSDVWMGTPTDAILTDVQVLPFSPDVAHGASYEVEFTYGGLPAVVPFVPPGPDTLPPPPDPTGAWRNIPDILQPPDDPPGAFGRPFLPSKAAFRGQAAVKPGAFCRPAVTLMMIDGLDAATDPGAPGAPTLRRLRATTAIFEWAAPMDDGGAPPVRYEYRIVQTAGTGGFSRDWTGPRTSRSLRVAGITTGAGFKYRFDVRSINNAGLRSSVQSLTFDWEPLS